MYCIYRYRAQGLQFEAYQTPSVCLRNFVTYPSVVSVHTVLFFHLWSEFRVYSPLL